MKEPVTPTPPSREEGWTLPVVLVHWNAPSWCRSATASILASEGVGIELTVVDNSSSPPLDPAALPAGVEVLRLGSNRGFTGGANAGLRKWLANERRLPYCLVGSHDLHVAPDALAALMRTADAHPGIGILGAWRGNGASQEPLRGGPHLVEREWVSGQCMLVRRECLVSVGLFDEQFGSYVEDVDLCYRARAAGWVVAVLPSAVSWGLGSIDPGARVRGQANLVLLSIVHHGRAAAVTRLVRLAAAVPRPMLGSVALWRPRSRRVSSAQLFVLRLRVVLDGLKIVARGKMPRRPDLGEGEGRIDESRWR